jgi:hypothetical protein
VTGRLAAADDRYGQCGMGHRALNAFKTLPRNVRLLWIIAAALAFEMILRAFSL